jgi:hypothetical protein
MTMGVSLGPRELAEADHWILALDPPPVWASTHLVRTPDPQVAISVSTEPAAPEAADQAAGTGGRAVLFPGSDRLVGVLTVDEVITLSAIDRVEILGGAPAHPTTEIDTRDFVRPHWRAGALVLTTTPAAGGRLVPFESPTPTPCCAGH